MTTEKTLQIGDRVTVLRWSDEQTSTPCDGTVAAVEGDRVYVRAGGKPGHWLALELEQPR